MAHMDSANTKIFKATDILVVKNGGGATLDCGNNNDCDDKYEEMRAAFCTWLETAGSGCPSWIVETDKTFSYPQTTPAVFTLNG